MRVILLLSALSLLSCVRERPGVPPEHVLLVTVENLRADHTHMWQYPRHTTFIERPDDQRSLDLDLLMERGVLFQEAFAPSGSTRPSLATLFTGLPSRAHGLVTDGGVLSEDVATIAERFKAAGFQTAAFASPSSPLAESGLSRGFDVFVEDHTELVFRDGVPVDGLLLRAFEYLKTEFDPSSPQLLWLHFGSPAPPWEPKPVPTSAGPIDFQKRYVDPQYSGPVESNIGFLEKVNRGEVSLSATDHDALTALYDGDLERANFLLRQLLEIYKHHFEAEEEVWESTLVVTAGLSGCELGERGYFGSEKSLHAQGLHVPLAFHHPRSLTGRRIFEDEVGLADVAPTLYEWMSVEPPAGVEGRSLLARTDRGRSLEPRPVIAELPGGLISARIGDWRMLLNRDASVREGSYEVSGVELYDTTYDPSELEDVSERHPEVVERLMKAIAQWERLFPPKEGASAF